MKKSLAIFAAIAFSITLARSAELRVAAAASLDESITEICALYSKKHGTLARPVLAGSNVLARQISQGAPIDVFLSADTRTMAKLNAEGHVTASTPLLENRLVVVVPSESEVKITSAEDLLTLQKIAIGDPAAVPAGVYAKKWLEAAGNWEKLSPRLVGTENVRGALAAVEAGNVQAAIVYKTDAATSTKVKTAFEVPSADSPEIIYPVAICTRATDPAEARKFLKFLRSPEATAIFQKRGFGIVEETQ